jgi:ribosomal protein S18 acetylase RimI-like enzyme
VNIARVGEGDLDALVPMMSSYCAFYGVDPGDDKLRELARELIADPAEGVLLIARDDQREPLGFATVYWTLNTLEGGRVGTMHDLYVRREHRGAGVGRALIEACLAQVRAAGLPGLTWDTAPDNVQAQALYDATGAERQEWFTYWLRA